ncbi:MAG TPA: flagellar hook-length control protein FliK [Roseomonas sp.]|nr:flagellar hook-length control protein FliK [Roseomonas sp.]
MTKPVGGEAVLLQASVAAGAEPRRGTEAASVPADGFALMLAGLLAGPQAGAAMAAATPSPPAEPVPAPVTPRQSSALPWDALAAAAEEASRLAAAFQMPLPAVPAGVEMATDSVVAAEAMPLSATLPSGVMQEAAILPLPKGALQLQGGLAAPELAKAGKAALPSQPDSAAMLSAAPSASTTPQADWPALLKAPEAAAASLPAGAQVAALLALSQDTAKVAPEPAILPMAAAPGASASPTPEAATAIPAKTETPSAAPSAEPKAGPASLAAEHVTASSLTPLLAQVPAAVGTAVTMPAAPVQTVRELPPLRATAAPPARPIAAAIPVDSIAPRMAAPALVTTAIAPSPAASEVAPYPAEKAAPPNLEAGARLDRVLSLTSALPEVPPDPQPLPLPSGQGVVAPAALSAPAPAAPAPAALPQHRMAAEAAPQLVLRMAQVARKEGIETILVDLRPPELGRVELQLTFRDGTVQVVMRAEQAETFEALRHERHNLLHQMEQAGLQLGGSGLDLQHGPLPQPKPEPEQALAGARRGTPEPEEAEGRAGAAPAARPRASDSLIDIIT